MSFNLNFIFFYNLYIFKNFINFFLKFSSIIDIDLHKYGSFQIEFSGFRQRDGVLRVQRFRVHTFQFDRRGSHHRTFSFQSTNVPPESLLVFYVPHYFRTIVKKKIYTSYIHAVRDIK